MSKTSRQFAALMLCGLVAGCGGEPLAKSFEPVKQTVSERSANIVQWRGRIADDADVDTAVRALLHQHLTADIAAQIALLNNRHLQATFEEIGIAQADLVQAGLLKNPVFDLSVRIPNRSPAKAYLDLGVAADFIDVFLVPARKRIAGAALRQSQMRVVGEVLSLAAQTKTAYFKYQAAVQLVELWQQIAEAAAVSAEAAKRLREAGNISALDALNQAMQDTRAKIDLRNAQADAAEGREQLNALMGLGEGAGEWRAGQRLADPPSEERTSEDLEGIAVRQRQDLAAAREEVVIQGQALGLTQQTRFFRSADVGAEAERETDGQWRIGPSLAIPIPLFDQGQATIARQRALLWQSRQKYAAMIVDVRSEVRVARTRLLHARERAQFYHEQVMPLANRLVEQTQLQYNAMSVSLFQLVQAKREEIDAATEYIAALRDSWTARAELERAIGGRLMPASTRPTPALSQ